MKKRIFWSIFLVSVVMMLVISLLLGRLFFKETEKNLERELEKETVLLGSILKEEGISVIGKLSHNTSSRVTLIKSDGVVVFDSFAEASKLSNHSQREEFLSAMENGYGSAKRLSDTLGYMTYYYAVRTADGNILRLALQSRSILGMMAQSIPLMASALILMLLLSVLVSSYLAGAILKPLGNIDPDRPLVNNGDYKEMQPLLVKLDDQNKRVMLQIEELRQQRSEFEQITSQMTEALVIFGPEAVILSMNESAKRIFHAPTASTAVQLCRQEPFVSAVKAAFHGIAKTQVLEINSRYYEISSSPVDKISGAVVLARDVTEREIRESARRDFSANVSHELKTPLTSILGYAELIKTSMAKSEDIALFGDTIYKDATRLLTIIEDTIRLSHLENGKLETEFTSVDLSVLCRNSLDQLGAKAKEKNVLLDYKGPDSLKIDSIQPLVSEMIYNLLDNAISYNKPQGKAWIELSQDRNSVRLVVADTGIGIPQEMQDRVFERFFRVDKSRSRLTGGTGLGLSIVKHSAIVLGADLKLESQTAKGTRITLTFTLLGRE